MTMVPMEHMKAWSPRDEAKKSVKTVGLNLKQTSNPFFPSLLHHPDITISAKQGRRTVSCPILKYLEKITSVVPSTTYFSTECI